MTEKSTTRNDKTFIADDVFASTQHVSDEDINIEQKSVLSTSTFNSSIETEIVVVNTSNDDDASDVDYVVLLVAKEQKTIKLEIKRKYEIAMQRNKRLLASLKEDEIMQPQLRSKRRNRARKTLESVFEFRRFSFDFSFEVEIHRFKKQRSFLVVGKKFFRRVGPRTKVDFFEHVSARSQFGAIVHYHFLLSACSASSIILYVFYYR